MSPLRTCIALCFSVSALLVGCDSATTGASDGDTRISVYLTDAPGEMAAVWVDVAEIYFQGGPGGRLTLSDTPTGMIELLSLRDRTAELVTGLTADPGMYSQLRFVVSAAMLETLEGDVYAFGGAEHPEGAEVTGELMCPSCSSSGIKVKLSGDAVEMAAGENALVLDFDVSQTFSRPAGNSGKWMMKPVIHATKVKGDDPEGPTGSTIAGSVTLAQNAEGGTVAIPMCPEGEPRSIRDFVPLASAAILVDGEGAQIVRGGEVEDDGSFKIDFVEPDTYAMGYEAEVPLDAVKLVFTATVEPESVLVAESTDVDGVAYVITGATCEANAGG